jgi:hypothetical protein
MHLAQSAGRSDPCARSSVDYRVRLEETPRVDTMAGGVVEP